ncbi:glycosyltransferase [Schaalia sp. ZJ1691]|uniref:glycosyltransferase n=1 Tax=Schaalia sp. ZJ1691 TaxID=2709404 RepID=UPI0013EB8431|nr:glycosyltransferase [Schaalia sp. ZJ1691]
MILTGLMVSRIFAPEPAAASLRLSWVKAGLEKCGARMRVLTTRPPAGIEAEDAPEITRVPVIRDSEGYVKGYLSYASFDIQAFLRILVSPRQDFILVEPPPTTGTVARVACCLRRTPYFWYAADVWSDATEGMEVPGIVKKTVRALESFAIRGAQGCIAVSDGVAQRIEALGARRVRVIPNGADTEIFTPEVEPLSDADRESMGIVHPYFVYAGTASQWQGAELFARAFEIFWETNPSVQLLYLTRGDAVAVLEDVAARLKERADSRGLNVQPIIVHSTVSPQEAAQWQHEAIASCVSIQPGVGYDIAYPTKALAALSTGTPVLYAGVGPAAQDIRTHELGLTVAYDEHAVAHAMTQLEQRNSEGTLSQTWDEDRLHQWVVDNRSMKAAGEQVAAFIAESITEKTR